MVSIALVVGGAFAFTYFEDQYQLIIRSVAITVVIFLAMFIAVGTEKGAAFWSLLKASQLEIRKVVWPTRQEVMQTTLIVMVIVVIAALILWGLDTIIGLIASNVIV